MAAALLASGYARLDRVPEPLRYRLQPEAANEIARYGTAEDIACLSNLPNEPRFAFAHALLKLRQGDGTKGLADLDQLARDKDAATGAEARETAIGFRASKGTISPDDVAEVYARLRLDARLAGREVPVRLAEAQALLAGKRWGKALVAYDQLAQLAPWLSPQINEGVEKAASALAAGDNGGDGDGSALTRAALIQGHIDQIPDNPAKGRILAGLGARLMALGLPDQAASAFEHALPLAETDAERAEWGEKLADADIALNRVGQAQRVMDGTTQDALPAAIADGRRILSARLLVQQGKTVAALAMLDRDDSANALDLRGSIMEQEKDWVQATQAVGRLATRVLPETGPLSEAQQDLALRLASDASRANDHATLGRLRERIGTRPLSPERQKEFDLLDGPHDVPSAG